MKLKDLLIVLFCLTLTLIVSCARQGSPTGGPKDTIPPTVIRMRPALETTNFDGTELEIEFSEYVEVKNLKKELIVNPKVSEYKYFTKKNTLVIRLEEELQENTTYTFNLRQAVVDVENNSARNALVAFSTGPRLDSFQVAGYVKDLKTQQPLENVVVGLYKQGDTVDIFNGAPTYFTKTDKNGFYLINYIKEGTYQIYSFDDQNTNLEYESNTEAIGFKDSLVVLTEDSVRRIVLPDSLTSDSTEAFGQSFQLVMNKKDIRPIKVQSNRPNGKYYEIKLNKPVNDYTLKVDSAELSPESLTYLKDSVSLNIEDSLSHFLFSNFQEQQQTIRIYNTLKQDSLPITLNTIDSANQQLGDTVIFIKFAESRRKPEEFSQQLNVTKSDITDSIKGKVKFSKPISHIQTDSILLVYDTLLSIPLSYDTFFTWNDRLDKVSFKRAVNKNKIAEQVLKQTIINDSIQFEQRKETLLKYQDSLNGAASTEDKLQYLGQINNVHYNPQVGIILDSIQTLEEGEVRNNLITGLADTLRVGEGYEPKAYTLEEIRDNLQPLTLYMAPGSFMSIENDSSQEVRQTYAFLNPDDYGTIKGKITSSQSSFFVQLIDESFKVIASTTAKENYQFENITPGSYMIRVLIDANENGKWEDGNILEGEEPEPVVIFSNNIIKLKAGWINEANLQF